MSELPDGWALCTLGQVAQRVTDGTHQSPRFESEGVPFLVIGNIKSGTIDWASVEKWVTPETYETCTARCRPERGDVLYTAVGSYGIALVVDVDHAFMFQRHIAHIKVDRTLVEPRYLAAALNGPALRSHADDVARGVAQKTVTLGELAQFPIQVPPLREQSRIVTKLDALQSRSRRAKDELDAIPPLLERFRQSVLAAAFRGDLTAGWRAENPDVEPASELLKRIRAERRHRWEESELARMKASGKLPINDRWKERYEEPPPVDPQSLPLLPESWAWASQEQITDADRGIPYGIVQTGDDTPDGVPTVRCGDLKDFAIGSSLKRVSRAIEAEYHRTRLQGGEVLIAIRGTVGATAVVPPSMVGMNISREVAMIPVVPSILADFLMFSLAADPVRQMLFKSVKGVAQSGINLSDLRTLPVPIAPLAEQRAVTGSIKDGLAACGRIGLNLAKTRTQLDNLDAATLAKAFRGELVPQDPADEPASALLARLAAERDTPAPSTPAAPARRSKRSPPRTKA